MNATTILPPDDFPLEADNPFADAHRRISDYMRGFSHSDAAIVKLPGSAQLLVARAGIERCVWLLREAGCTCNDFKSWLATSNNRHLSGLQDLLSRLDYTHMPLLPNEVQQVAAQLTHFFENDPSELKLRSHFFPIGKALRYFEKYFTEQAFNQETQRTLQRLADLLTQRYDLTNMLGCRMERLVDTYLLPDTGQPWADAARTQIVLLPPGQRTA